MPTNGSNANNDDCSSGRTVNVPSMILKTETLPPDVGDGNRYGYNGIQLLRHGTSLMIAMMAHAFL